MKDRRARLRPRDGARELYYGSGNSVDLTSNFDFFVNQNRLPWQLPWQSSKPFAELSPNVPQFLNNNDQTQNVGRRTETNNILYPLSSTDGLVFPYTPIIGLNQSVNYNSYDPVHSNQEILAYTRTAAPQITCSGEFTVQNSQEASYAIACIHFLRTVTKMDFGLNSPNTGTPPPVLIFSAYGEYMFNEVPVIIQGFDIQFENGVDYVRIPNSNTYVPTNFTISIVMIVQNPPQRLRQFNSKEFRNGDLVKRGGWL